MQAGRSFWVGVVSREHVEIGVAGGFISNKTHWGAAFRFGMAKIPAEDFFRIAEAMGAEGVGDQWL